MTDSPTQPAALTDAMRAARANVAIWALADAGLLLLDGSDAAAFLHNVLTADIKRIPVGGGCPAAQTTPRGECEALVTVYRTAEHRWLVSLPGSDTPRLLGLIEKLHFSENFTAQDVSARLSVVAVQGASATQLLATAMEQALAAAVAALAKHASLACIVAGVDVRLVREELFGAPGFLLVIAAAKAAGLLTALTPAATRLGAVPMTPELLDALRIESGLPKFGVDLPAKALVSELGIEDSRLNYDKGCYIGQEIIARIRTKGSVPVRAMGLLFAPDAPVPASGDLLTGDDGNGGTVPAATVTSATFSPAAARPAAIARVNKAFQIEGTKLHWRGGHAEVVALPFHVTTQPSASTSRALYDSALTLFAKGDEPGARALLEQELAANPNNLDGWEALGVIHDRAGRHRDAIDAMKKIVAADPKHLMANVNLSMFHMKLGDKQTAEEWQAKATSISLERRIAEARAKGGAGAADAEAERLQKLEQRLSKFRQIIEMDPADVLGHFGAGKACLDLKRFGEAATHFEKVISIQPDYSVAWSNLGQAYVALGENEKARTTFERGIEVARNKGDMMPVRDMQMRLEKLPPA